MGLSADKRDARLAIHGRMGEPCTYTDGEGTRPNVTDIAEGLELTVRFSTKQKVNLGDSDGLTVMEPIEKLIFNKSQLTALALTLESGAMIEIPEYEMSLYLDSPLDGDGPENVYWTVTRV